MNSYGRSPKTASGRAPHNNGLNSCWHRCWPDRTLHHKIQTVRAIEAPLKRAKASVQELYSPLCADLVLCEIAEGALHGF